MYQKFKNTSHIGRRPINLIKYIRRPLPAFLRYGISYCEYGYGPPQMDTSRPNLDLDGYSDIWDPDPSLQPLQSLKPLQSLQSLQSLQRTVAEAFKGTVP